MTTANLDLCKELYELSGWDDSEWKEITQKWRFKHRKDTNPELAIQPYQYKFGEYIPAYDLGYLLRKLPRETILSNISDNGWTIVYGGKGLYKATTPENAACKLAIELFKKGIL